MAERLQRGFKRTYPKYRWPTLTRSESNFHRNKRLELNALRKASRLLPDFFAKRQGFLSRLRDKFRIGILNLLIK